MNNPNLPQPTSDPNIEHKLLMELHILENGEIRIPWVPSEFEALVKNLLSPQEQDDFLFGPMLCG